MARQPPVQAGADRQVSEAAAILGVPIGATAEEVRAAFKRRALKVHPDKGGTGEAFRAVRGAFELLSRETPTATRMATSAPAAQRARSRTPRRKQPKQRKATAKAGPPRTLSPRSEARRLGMFPSASAAAFGFPLL